jgi:ASC-1-like (ASCH) protein
LSACCSSLVELALTVVYIKYFSTAAKKIERSVYATFRQLSAKSVLSAESIQPDLESMDEQAQVIAQRMYEDYGEKFGMFAALPVYLFTSGTDPVALLKWSFLVSLEIGSDESKWIMLKRMGIPMVVPHWNVDARTLAYVLSGTCAAKCALLCGFILTNCEG